MGKNKILSMLEMKNKIGKNLLGKIFSAILAIPIILFVVMVIPKGILEGPIDDLADLYFIIFPVLIPLGIVLWRLWLPQKSTVQKWLGRISALILLPVIFYILIGILMGLALSGKTFPSYLSGIALPIGIVLCVSIIILNWIVWTNGVD